MNTVDAALLVIVLCFLAVALARRIQQVPEPVTLAALGLGTGLCWHLIPGLPLVRLPPDRVMLVFLPPLLTAAAYALPLRAFRRNLAPIAMLSIGLVLVTMAGAAVAVHYGAGLPWASAMVLGAIVAPPDPVASTTVASKSGLAHRLVVILEGEGLINDATAIVAYHLALAAALSTQPVTWSSSLQALATEAPTGVAAGWILGWIVTRLRRRMDDVTLEAGVSLIVPYMAYEIADRLHGSGVLAVVTLGFMLQRQRNRIASPVIRLATRIVWGAVRFVSNALVFFLLGLLMGEILAEVRVSRTLVIGAAELVVVVVAVRVAWMFVAPRLMRLLPGSQPPVPSNAELSVLGWAGMRGVVSLALALSLPELPGTGTLRDPRSVIILLTFAVIAFTLLVQGSTLNLLIRHLSAGDPDRDREDERRIRGRARRAGLAAFARVMRRAHVPGHECQALAERLERGEVGIAASDRPFGTADTRALQAALDAQRMVLDGFRQAGRAGESLTERLATAVDADAARLGGETSRLTGLDEG